MSSTFDAAARNYNTFMRISGLFKDQLVLQELGLLGEEKIVDLGGGTGHYAALLSPHCREVTVVDESKKMLARVPQLRNISTLQADISATGLADSLFDTALLLDVIHHTQNQEKVLDEMRRILKPGGQFLMLDFNAGDIRTKLLGVLERLLFGRMHYRTPEEMADLLAACDFTDITLLSCGWCYLLRGIKA